MKKILPLLLYFTVFLLFNGHAQQPVMDWFKLIGGNGHNVALEMELDGAENIYVVGSFTESLDFDPDSTTSHVLSSGGKKDGYILKLGPDGNLLWVKQIKGPGDNVVNSIYIDDYHNSYTTGYFSDQISYGSNTYLADSTDVFIQKRNSSGDRIWTITFGGSKLDEGESIAIDDVGNVYVTGTFEDTMNIGQTQLLSNGMKDIFNCKFDSSGNLMWAHNVGGPEDDEAQGIKTVDIQYAGTCLYISATFQNTVNFYGLKTYTSAGLSDIVGFMLYAFTGSLVSTPQLDYVARMGGALNDRSSDFVFDKDLIIYSTGSFQSTADLNPKDLDTTLYHVGGGGSPDAFILKMSKDADFLWAHQFGGQLPDRGTAIGIDTSGNVYTVGGFFNNCEFNFLNDTISFVSLAYKDIYINKISPSGNLIWIAQISGDSSAYVYDIEIDNNGDIYLAGHYTGGINFIGDNSLGTIGSSSTPNNDIFILKLNQRYGMSGLLLDSISNGIDSGMVYLIELDPNAAGADTLERAYTDTAGRFHFNFVDTGSYIMKADATEEHPTTMPTYYPNAFYWYDAEIFELVSDTNDIKIDILYTPTPPTPAQGMGRIWGRLVEGSTFRGPSDPIDSIVIGMIRPDISNDVYMLDTTDIDGYFEFLNLPAGNYALYPDISGIPVDTVGWTDISISASDTETITFVADSNIITYDNDTIIVHIKEYTSDLKLCPNPVYDHLSVSLTSPIKAVRVFDMKGAEVEVESILTEKRVQIKTGSLQKGIYILELQYEGRTGLAKFVKQ